jgi:BirA family transcriptional regulator, biotin operon repressor / biotin---[acetyl-CoA-carboxylase] ligase
MKVPQGEFAVYPSVASTQDIAAERLKIGEKPAVIFAHEQRQGRGRFQRSWHSKSGDSLTMTVLFHDYQDHKEPWLIGMAVAIAVAGTIHCQIQWPNDLVFGDKKVGGILTDLQSNGQDSKIPVIGIGINLNQLDFPDELAHRATSIKLHSNRETDAETLARKIISNLQNAPEPDSWASLQPAWELFDNTPGKPYKFPNGETATALGVGPNGQLLCSLNGETTSVMAAEACFGTK